ncbi:Serine_threonine-protein kinase PknD [Streptomyces sp. enrichment culture]|uniref:serine/threonine-protein kinase n=1 Tax=Streptomyces sp. enrichment culture TaxID=1795815 RepID=UPI003F570973
MEPLASDDAPVVGAYRLLRRLDRGGMGRVYLGRSAGGRTVAVKVVHPQFAVDERFRARFAREVAAARLVGGSGAFTAPVLDADPDAELPWVATGYVAGPDLRRTVGEVGPLPVRTVRALGAGLAEALVAVHGHGLVHRDVKPSNVLLAVDGPRLIDFGIARAVDAAGELTATGVSLGSPAYMSPEQVLGVDAGESGAVGPATDVFSLGAVLAYAAAGRPPFPGESLTQLLYQVVHQAPALAGVPQELRPLVAAMLAKEPAARPSPGEVARALAGDGGAAPLVRAGWLPPEVVEGIGRRAVELLDLDLDVAPPPDGGAAGPVPAPPPAPAAAASPAAVPPGFGPAIPLPVPAPAVPPAPPAPPPAPPRPRRGLRAALAAVLVLGLAGAGVYAFTRPDTDGAADPGDPVVEESPREPVAQELPEGFLGEWEGDLTLDIGIPGGRMTLTMEGGAVGEETGYASATDLLGLSTCVDRMTLTSVSGNEAVFDALLDTEQSTRGTCVTEEFQMVLRLDGEGQVLRYTSVHPDSGAQGVLNRPG